ncbi:MAG: hypothetical protein FWG97_02090 [Deltaproteobacteria bacterium]|nr:hypothetical protein [Deltaproteobacteria bacterium]
MKKRGFGLGLLALALAGFIWAGGAQKCGAEEETPAQPSPADWARVDGQDRDLDEMLSLFRPKGAETLAIFAPLQSWKPFYDKVYGQTPIDLAHYAAIYRFDGYLPPNLDDWPSFYWEDPNQPLPDNAVFFGPLSPVAATFKTTLAAASEGGRQDGGQDEGTDGDDDEEKGARTTYAVVTSLILTSQEVFFLNLFQAGQNDFAELERLALAWRADFLNAQPEETWSEQDPE